MINKKKLIWLIWSSFLLWSMISNAGFYDTLNRAYDNWLTKFNTIADFRPNDGLRRDEATKFFIKFAEWQFELVESTNNCKFTDINLAWKDLTWYINQACKYGIINGFNNKFMPNDSLTNEQIVAMVARVEFGKQDEKNVSRWSDNYYKIMENYNLIAFQDRTGKAIRKDVISLLYDVVNENYIWDVDILKELIESLD